MNCSLVCCLDCLVALDSMIGRSVASEIGQAILDQISDLVIVLEKLAHFKSPSY